MEPDKSPIKKIIVLVAVFASVIIAVILIQTFILKTALTVNLNENNSGLDTSIVIREAATNTEIARRSAKAGRASFRLAPGSYTVTAVNDASETLGFTKLKRFKSGRLGLDLHKEKSVQKLGSGSLGCDRVINSQLYSHACTSPSTVVRHENQPDRFVFPTPLNEGVKQQVNARPYLGGIMARFENHETRYFDYLELASNQRLRLPVPENSPENYTVYTDETSADSPRLVLVDTDRQLLYAYRDLTDTQPVKVGLPGDENAPPVSFSLAKNQFIVYAGLSDYASDTREEEISLKEIKQSYIYTIDLASSAAKFQQIKMPADFRANEVTVLGQDLYLVQKMATTEIYRLTGGSFELTYIMYAPAALSVGKDGSLLFVKDGGLFRYDAGRNQAHRLYSTPRVRVSRTGFSNEGRPVINGFVDGDLSRKLHSYQVMESAVAARRWEEFLPYSTNSGLPIVQMDYVGEAIKVQLSLRSFTSDRRSGKVTYDPVEFESAKQAVLRQLRTDGINTDTTSITFTH